MVEDGAAVAGSPEGGGAEGSAQAGGAATAMPDFTTFRSTLGDLGKEKSLDSIKDFNGLTKSFVDAQKMIGGSIRLPSKDLKPEEREKAVKDLTGRLIKEGIIEGPPETPDKYEIKTPQVEGWKANDQLIGGFKEQAHKLGITPSQAQGLFDWYLNFQESAETQGQEEFEQMRSGLQKEWGGLYRRKLEAARRAAAKFIGADADELISHLPPKAGKRLVQAFAEIGEPMLEEAIISGEALGLKDTQAGEIKKKIEAMMFDKAHPLNDISHPQHKQAVEQFSQLSQLYVQAGGK